MKLLDLVAGIFQPAADLVDSLHTSEDEKLEHQRRLLEVQAAVLDQALSYERDVFQAQADIIRVEAGSEHWIAATWRPITMLVLLGLVVLDATGILHWAAGKDLSEQAWTLLQIGLGGYVVGRSAEKITKTIKAP